VSLAAVVVLIAPAVLLAVAARDTAGDARAVSLGVAITIAVEGLFLMRRYGAQRAAGSMFAVAFYATAAFVLRFNAFRYDSAVTHGMLAATLLMPVALLARREVALCGGGTRRVRFLINKLLNRNEWPTAYSDFRHCPVIKALREGVHDDATPVLPLLAHQDVRIQIAALTALEFHPNWRKGQAEAVLQRATFTDQPAVRAAALMALANVVKTRHLMSIVPYLRDSSEEVRRAAAIAVLSNVGNRWADVRGQIRLALAAPHAARDGPLPCSGGLPQAAIDDLMLWSVESGPVGKRATQTLVRHCKKAIQDDGSPEAIARVAAMVANPKVPAAMRVEMAHRLQQAEAFPPEVASKLLGPANPTMLRVIAAGALLSVREDLQAVSVLREAAKQPNREITLAAAGLVQKYLGVDLGLPVGGQLPKIHTREAADITRRVLKWASDPGSNSSADTPADSAVQAADIAFF
jgi:HEAT repeat protein